MMEEIRFRTRMSALEDYKVVDIFINGFNLIEVFYRYELPFAQAEGLEPLAGAYEGLPPLYVLPPSEHFFGHPAAAYRYGDKTGLLEYSQSGIPGDWPLVAKIEVQPDTIRWRDFEQVQRPKTSSVSWDYTEFGAFIFDRKQYEEALEIAAREAY